MKLSEDLQAENEKLAEANRKLQAENEKAQNTFKEAAIKTEDAKRILAEAKALNDSFDKRVMEKVSRVKRTIEADMKGRLQSVLYCLEICLIGLARSGMSAGSIMRFTARYV